MRDGKKKRADELVIDDSLMPFYRKLSSHADGDYIDGYEKVYDPSLEQFIYTQNVISSDPECLRLLKLVNPNFKRDPKKFYFGTARQKLYEKGDISDSRWSTFKEYALRKKNHKVASIEFVNRIEDVYCMTVVGPNGEEDRHNFAAISRSVGACQLQQLQEVKPDKKLSNSLSGGILLGNSIDEDYFLPTRGNETGTKIETLAGGTHVSDITDVEYLQSKLFAALKVPRAYLGYDDSLSSKATLCLRGSTKIKLTDGRVIPISEMSDAYVAGERFEVYSYDIENSSIVYGNVERVWPTKQVTELHHVTLDTGETIDCTENHPFLMCDGTYVRADALRPGDSLMADDKLLHNHNVISVEVIKLDAPEWVYDLTVEKHHNFAIDIGIYLHNSQEDIRFSRSINKIQKVILSELEKICIIHLFAHGYEGDDLTDFSLLLSNPSTVAQQQKLELWRTKFEIAGTVPEGFVDRDFVRKEIFMLSDDQIDKIKEGRRQDKIDDLELEASELEGNEPSEAFGGGGGSPGAGIGGLGTGGDEGPGFGEEEPEAGGEEGEEEPEAAGEEPEGEKVDLFAGAEDISNDGDDLLATEKHGIGGPKSLSGVFGTKKSEKAKGPLKGPANVTSLSRYLYNRGRRKTHGPRKTGMPNLSNFVSFESDPFDKRFFRKDPFGENIELSDMLLNDTQAIGPRRLSLEMQYKLSSLKSSLIKVGGKKRVDVLVEMVERHEAHDDEVDVIIDDDEREEALDALLDGVIDMQEFPPDKSE
jgi:hypothetical protein